MENQNPTTNGGSLPQGQPMSPPPTTPQPAPVQPVAPVMSQPTPQPAPVQPVVPVMVQPTPQPAPVQPVAPVMSQPTPQPAPVQPVVPVIVQPTPQPAPVQPVAPIMVQPTSQPAPVQPMSPPPATPQPAPVQPPAPVMPQPTPQQQPAPQFAQQPPTQFPRPMGQPMSQPQQGGAGGRPLPPRPGTRPLVGKPGGPDPKKLIFGCLGFIAFSLILFIFFVIAYVSQTTATGENGLANTLGVNPSEFTNTLILLTNLIFGVIVMVAFFVAVFGLFTGAMAPKTDKPARSKGFKRAGIAGAIFIVLVTVWVFTFMYLSGKQVNIPQQQAQTQGIVTDPAVTIALTAPIDIKFDATKIPYNANAIEITFYQWDFGDGFSSTSPVVTHTYREIGQYNAQLTMTARNKKDNSTLTESFETLVTVIDVQISADFSFTPESGPAPLKVSFDAGDSVSPGNQITSYEWDFRGQNNFRDATGEKAEYTFDREGDYEVRLRITDDTGKSAITSQTITIGGPDIPVAVIDIPSSDGKYYVGKALNFLAEKSTSPNGAINKYEWDFGDGGPKASTRTANHSYSKAGLYEVILKITDETGKTGTSSEKLKLIVQEQAPQAIIKTKPALTGDQKVLNGQVPFEVTFDASASTDPDDNIIEFKWDFDGDGQSDADGTIVTYVYKTPGSYNATLTAIDSANNESSNMLVVKVAAQDLTAKLTADAVEGVSPLSVKLDASGSFYPDGQITSFEWDFGDGSPKLISGSQVSYKYVGIGTFTAQVVVKASDGKSASDELVINVRPVALQSCFIPSVEQGNAPLDIEFDPRCSQGPVAKYLWDFGDGTTSRTRKPAHSFDKPGSYQVTLEVSDSQNIISSFSKNILVIGEVQS